MNKNTRSYVISDFNGDIVKALDNFLQNHPQLQIVSTEKIINGLSVVAALSKNKAMEVNIEWQYSDEYGLLDTGFDNFKMPLDTNWATFCEKEYPKSFNNGPEGYCYVKATSGNSILFARGTRATWPDNGLHQFVS